MPQTMTPPTKQQLKDILIDHKQYIAKHGEDLPEIRSWKWRIPEPSARPTS